MNEFEKCIEKRKLKKIIASKELVKKELSAAVYDLNRAQKSFSENDFKWTAIQAYYSVFHAAKAMVLSKGFIEKSHYCLLVAFNKLIVEPGLIEKKYYLLFDELMVLRENADYGLKHLEKRDVEPLIKESKEFISLAKKALAEIN